MEKDMTYKKLGDRNKLAGEHPWGDAGQLILVLIFLVVRIGDSFVFHFSTFLAHEIPIYVRLPIALVILAGSVYFIWAGHRIIFDEISEQPRMIRTGVFN